MTAQHSLTYGAGLTVAQWHPVTLRRNGVSRAALVYIPRRGFPRLTVETGHGWLVCYRVRGDVLEEINRDVTTRALSEFRARTAGALPTVDL